jgi:hypothetical protein
MMDRYKTREKTPKWSRKNRVHQKILSDLYSAVTWLHLFGCDAKGKKTEKSQPGSGNPQRENGSNNLIST